MTRIISGRFRGRRLTVPAGTDIRPTTDRMRERLFSMLGHSRYPAMAGARVADLFAGTGALGLEALSRGAAHVTFVEQAHGSLACLRANIETVKADDHETTIVASNATGIARTDQSFDFIFLDPPYRKSLVLPTLNRLLEMNWVHGNTAIICELASNDAIDLPESLCIIDDRKQGKQRIMILTKKTSAS